MTNADLYSGLIRLHVLHHAVSEPIYGLGIIEELARHGYRVSPGTMYPLLRGLERRGYLRIREVREGKRMRKLYAATARGVRALASVRSKVRELFGELFEEDGEGQSSGGAGSSPARASRSSPSRFVKLKSRKGGRAR
jgi:DNA-binding PadR family transcriptional regulator